ncbi:MAG: helix-turn-helix domain-containing protein [Planctomycetota bacterium]
MRQNEPTEINARIARRLRAARTARRVTRPQLARRSGLSARTIERCEHERHRLTADELQQLAAALQLSVDHFVGACMLCGNA